MRIEPRLPDDRVNIPKKHPLKELLQLVLGIGLFLVVLFSAVALTADRMVTWVSPETEIRLFQHFGKQLFNLQEKSKDFSRPELQQLLENLSHYWPQNPYKLKLSLLNEKDPNALALPGGFVLVTSGLLDKVHSENELAFVLAHEIGHFANRDHLRGLGRTIAIKMLFASIFGLGPGGVDVSLGKVVEHLTQSRFSRGQERAADLFALQMIFKKYGHLAGALDFFRRISSDKNAALDHFSAYISSHPAPSDRIQYLRTYAHQKGWKLIGKTTPLQMQRQKQ